MRLLCTADLHIGKGGPDRLADQEHAWEAILQLALTEQVDAILFAGDAFEGPIPAPEHYDAFLRPLRKLDGRIPVLAISGNGRHDSAMHPPGALKILDSRLIRVSSRPELVELPGVTVATLPWVDRGWLTARLDGAEIDDVHAVMAEQLVDVAGGILGVIPPEATAVLLAHWSVTGAALPNGLPVEHAREPILPLDELESLGFDAVVLGHIHRPQLLSTGAVAENTNGSHVVPDPCPVFYCGSPLPLDHGEANCEHGVWILDTAGGLDFHPIESRQWLTYDFTAEEALSLLDLDDREDAFDGAIVRVRYTATPEQARRIDIGAIRRALLEAGAHRVSFEPTIIREQRARLAGLDHSLSEGEAFDRWLDHTHDGITVERRRVICDRFHRLLENTA